MDKKNKKLDIFLLILLPILSTFLSFYLRLNFLVSTMLFFGLPSLWLSYRNKNLIKKNFLFSIAFSIPLTFIIDYTMVISKGWYRVDTIFPIRLFNIIVIEQFIWSFLFVFFVIIFYEYFLDNIEKNSIQIAFARLFKKKENIFNKKMKWFSLFLFIGLILFFIFIFVNPIFFNLNYAYFIIGMTVGLIPTVIFLILYPHFLYKFFKLTIYFYFIAILFEFIGIGRNYWFFPATSKFLGWFTIFNFSIPFEEFFFYFLIMPAGILSYYEFFHDDRK